jgi:dephospho-CoA kinase
MKIIGLTGGIGSGKSTVAKIFEVLSVPIYYSDDRAKEIYFLPQIKKKVIQLLGENAYLDEMKLNKKFVSDSIFSDRNLLQNLNNIIHPAVDEDFNLWKQQQTSTVVIKEAAILFETGIYKKLDATILVICPESKRIERVCKRDGVSIEEVKKRIENQFTDEKKSTMANWIINNDDEDSLIKQCVELHKKLAIS